MSDQEQHIPVFYEGQDDLIDILATSMVSVCYNTSSFIDFYILDCGICDFNKRMLESLKEKFHNFSIEYIPVDLSQFKGLKGWGPNKDALDVYARLLIPDLKPSLKKVIYLDSDTIALGDIRLLFDVDLGEYPYAAAPELGYNDVLFQNCVHNLNISANHIYPSAGVLVLNLNKIKSSNLLVSICRDFNHKLIVYNEEIFSIAFGCNNYKRLDLRYNIADRINYAQKVNAKDLTDDYVKNEWKHVVIQHLTPTKPWKYLRNEQGQPVRNLELFWFFAKMTPFYEGMQNKFLYFANENMIFSALRNLQLPLRISKMTMKLFYFIPFLKSELKNNKIFYKLFGFIPLLKIKKK